MNNFQAIQSFWEGFGVSAYDEQTYFSSGQSPAYPHITYEAFDGTWGNNKAMTANLWNRSQSWAWLKKKADQIKKQIGTGVTIPVDDGIIWVRVPEYNPFAQVIQSGSDDDLVKRILLNVEVEFLTVR